MAVDLLLLLLLLVMVVVVIDYVVHLTMPCPFKVL